jgi:hypothetical protein
VKGLEKALTGVERLAIDTTPIDPFIQEHPRNYTLVALLLRRVDAARPRADEADAGKA